jgi:hypothetical protein
MNVSSSADVTDGTRSFAMRRWGAATCESTKSRFQLSYRLDQPAG